MYPSEFRTQKARGLAVLAQHTAFYTAWPEGTHRIDDRKFSVFPTKLGLEQEFPRFARPCPTVPRHGFVDSRVIWNNRDMQQVIADTLKEDPNGEVIFMKRLTGEWSGVMTQAGVSYGHGHDGATSGLNTVTIPSHVSADQFKGCVGDHICEKAGITQAPYVEFVEDEGVLKLVQLRDGPELPASADFIPKPIIVQEILYCDGYAPLLEWEEDIAEAAKRPGVVVHHPGGNLSSHYAVHAIVHGIPVITGYHAPTRGSMLEPNTEVIPPDYKALAEIVRQRLDTAYGIVPKSVQQMFASMSVAVMHASPMWGPEQHLLRLRAEGAVAMATLVTAACAGELRHWNTHGPGEVTETHESIARSKHPGNDCWCDACTSHREVPNPPLTSSVRLATESNYVGRRSIYVELLNLAPNQISTLLPTLVQDLNHWGWSQGDGDGYGGPAWGSCAKQAQDLFAALNRFVGRPGAGGWRKVMAAYNRVVNAAHNNGRVLNKFIDTRTMLALSLVPAAGLTNPLVADMMLFRAPGEVWVSRTEKVPLAELSDDDAPALEEELEEEAA